MLCDCLHAFAGFKHADMLRTTWTEVLGHEDITQAGSKHNTDLTL